MDDNTMIQGDSYEEEDDGFNDYEEDSVEAAEESPNKELVDEAIDDGVPKEFKKIVDFIVSKLEVAVIIFLVVTIVVIGVMVISFMSTSNPDVGGINQMIEMLDK